MMEIAISLAIIGIALVAIIGVLPIGMNVQQENRQQTIVGQDATVFMEAIRNGQLGLDDLTNYVYAITNYWALWTPGAGGPTISKQGENGYTFARATVDSGYPYSMTAFPLTNGANIIGLLSTPEFIGPSASTPNMGAPNGEPMPSLYFGGISNHIVAYVYSISGSAVEKPPQNNPLMQQDSFGYRIYCVNSPLEISTNVFCYHPVWPGRDATPYVFYNWTYWSSQVTTPTQIPGYPPANTFPEWSMVPENTLLMAQNTHNVRLTFEWPQLANGSLGSGRQTFRTIVSGQLTHLPMFNPATIGTATPILWNTNLYVYQSQSYTNAP